MANSCEAQIGPASNSSAACRIVTPQIFSRLAIAQSSEEGPRSPLMPGCTIRQRWRDHTSSGMAIFSIGAMIRSSASRETAAMIAAVSREAPDLIIAPMLKIAIPEEVWSRHLCLIVHPGIKGDRGPSSLDWAIANHEKIWGVTILEAADEFDAGPIWASHEFALEADPPAKSSLYRGQVTEAAVRGVIEAVARIESGEFRSGSWQPQKLTDVAPHGSPTLRGCLRPPMRQADRAIDWMQDRTALIVRKIRAADSAPGVLGTLLGKTCFLYGVHEEERLQRSARQGSGPARRRDLHRHGRWRRVDLASEGQG